MITVHHLSASRSHRVVWLCEELELPYRIHRWQRDPQTRLAPPAYRALHPLGTAPTIADGNLVLPESGAIATYLIETYGQGRLAIAPQAIEYPQYLFWFHFADATLMANLTVVRTLLRVFPGNGELLRDPIVNALKDRNSASFAMAEKRLLEAPYFAGAEFTAADIMMFFPLTTMGPLAGIDINSHATLSAYWKRLTERPAYIRACAQTAD